MFNIQDDISPLRGEFFGRDSGLNNREVAGMAERWGEVDAAHLESMKVIDAYDKKRARDLDYEINVQRLQDMRDKSERERDSIDKMPSLMEDLYSVMDNEELDPYSKQAEIGALALRYPFLVANNKVAGTMLDGANNVLSSDIKRATDAATADARGNKDAVGFAKEQSAWAKGVITSLRGIKPMTRDEVIEEQALDNEEDYQPKQGGSWRKSDLEILDELARNSGLTETEISKFKETEDVRGMKAEIAKRVAQLQRKKDRAAGLGIRTQAETEQDRIQGGFTQ
jgi:hypothetical protein